MKNDCLHAVFIVHCRKRHSDHGILKAPSTSANTYWQFEKESDPRSGECGRSGGGGKIMRKRMECEAIMMLPIFFTGEPLSWGERCRIKHLPTRKYLAVIHSEGEYQV